MRTLALLFAACIGLASCDAPPDTLAGRIQTAAEKACNFRADYDWLVEVVTKADITAQAVDAFAQHLCERVIAARALPNTPQALLPQTTPYCPNGSIEIEGQTICIKGEDVPEPDIKE